MKNTIVGITIVLSLLVSFCYADEASQRLIAEDLLQAMKFDQMMKPFYDQIRSNMEQHFAQLGAPDDLKPILKRYTDKLFGVMEQTSGWRSNKQDIINLYIHTFTEAELKGMLEFYSSPVGRSAIDKMPIAMQKSMEIVQKRMPEMQQKIKKITEEFIKEIKQKMEKKEKPRDKKTEEKA